MSIWEDTSLIDFSMDPEWRTVWERGGAYVFPASPAGVGLDLTVGETHLGMHTSAGLAYSPEVHFCLGTVDGVMVFCSLGEGPVAPLRECLPLLSNTEVELALRAVALASYHMSHRYCSQCGVQTKPDRWGRMRICDSCGTEHFPRIDPAIIVAVTDDRDRLLLGHHTGWDEDRYSVFAGFVEAGESLEQAVHRELSEEVHIGVHNIHYAGSQPWPMPRSLMIGFTAQAVSQQAMSPDGEEITKASWFTRDEVRAGVSNSQIVLPTPVSIAYRLIMAWLNQDSACDE